MVEGLPAGSTTALNVWMPARPSDSAAAFKAQADAWVGPGITHVWDGDRDVAKALAETLKVRAPAWDVYLAYPRGVRWEGDAPPAPASWMHQMPGSSGAPPELAFAPEKFVEAVVALATAPTPAPSPTVSPGTPVPRRK